MKRDFAAQFGERFTRRLFGWLKFLSPQPRRRDFRFASTSFWGYFGIFTTAHRAVVPHFRFKKDLIFYLNSSRAASSGEFKFKPFLNKNKGFSEVHHVFKNTYSTLSQDRGGKAHRLLSFKGFRPDLQHSQCFHTPQKRRRDGLGTCRKPKRLQRRCQISQATGCPGSKCISGNKTHQKKMYPLRCLHSCLPDPRPFHHTT
jgi:hypothetical protein